MPIRTTADAAQFIARSGWGLGEVDKRLSIIGIDRHHPEFCKHSLKIANEAGSVVPFELQPGQLKLWRAAQEQSDKGLSVRIRVLKARRVRMSAGAASIIWRRVAFFPGQHARCMADISKNTTNIFTFYKQYTETYDPTFSGVKMRKLAKPISTAEGHQQITFGGDSWIDAHTAGSATGGRGANIQHLHLSESGFWEHAGTTRAGLLQVVPDQADTTVIEESTANGVGGAFWEGCMRSMHGGDEYTFVFFAWWEEPKYAMPVPDVGRFLDSLDRTEQGLMDRFRLRPEQLAWRRWAIRNKCDGNIDIFKQEYPSHADEAFLMSGRTVFDMGALEGHVAVDQPATGSLKEEQYGTRTSLNFIIRQDGKGELRVWRKPVPGRLYVIGADPAQGIDVSAKDGGASDPDYSAACVLDQDTGEQVAVLHDRIEPDPFGEYLCDVARWYNWAYIVPEAVGVGVALVEAVLRRSYPMQLIFQRRRDPKDRRPPLLQELGFLTNEIGRAQLVSMLERSIRDRSITLVDPFTIQQLRTFVRKPNGRAEAADKCHDDLVFAAALARIGINYAPRERPGMTPGGLHGQQAAQVLRPVRYVRGGRR